MAVLTFSPVSATENSQAGTSQPFNLVTFSPVSATENSQAGPSQPVNNQATYQYNAATQFAQWGFANLPKGKFAIERDTYGGQTDTPQVALSEQDGSSFYLPAQTLAGSSNTSGTTGSIPAGSLNYGQQAWPAYDTSQQYSPSSTASGIGPYGAYSGTPYTNPYPVFNETLAIMQMFDCVICEMYETDILYCLNARSAGSFFGGGITYFLLTFFLCSKAIQLLF